MIAASTIHSRERAPAAEEAAVALVDEASAESARTEPRRDRRDRGLEQPEQTAPREQSRRGERPARERRRRGRVIMSRARESAAMRRSRRRRSSPLRLPSRRRSCRSLDIPILPAPATTGRRVRSEVAEHLLDSVLDALPGPKQPPGQGRQEPPGDHRRPHGRRGHPGADPAPRRAAVATARAISGAPVLRREPVPALRLPVPASFTRRPLPGCSTSSRAPTGISPRRAALGTALLGDVVVVEVEAALGDRRCANACSLPTTRR